MQENRDNLARIRQHYGVPASIGGRVRFRGNLATQEGTIQGVSAGGDYLDVLLDGQKQTRPFHPTWKLQYLDEFGSVRWSERVQ